MKLLNLLISVIPLIIGFYYLVRTWDPNRLRLFAYSLSGLGVITTFAIMFINPFDYSTPYEFSLLRWSHVLYGRFISIVFLFSIYLLFEKGLKIRPVYMCLLASLFFTGTYLSGLRAALLGLLIIAPPLFIWGIRNEKFTIVNTAIIVLSSVVMIFFINLTAAGNNPLAKYAGTASFNGNDLIMDGPANARIEAAEISWEMFKERPLFGSGLGGFNRFYNSELPERIRYPHNIFLEIGVEFGIAGLIGFVFLLWRMFKSARRLSIYWLVFLGYSLWLALFAKDVSTNTLLWLGVAIVPFSNHKQRRYMGGIE